MPTPTVVTLAQKISEDQQREGPPPAKRTRTKGDLIPADAFIQQHPGPVRFFVQCPSMPEKTEWNLRGQRLRFELPVTDEVSVVKALIKEETRVPVGKQKLQVDGSFVKDKNTLASYNLTEGCTLVLQVKQRGGRRKK